MKTIEKHQFINNVNC